MPNLTPTNPERKYLFYIGITLVVYSIFPLLLPAFLASFIILIIAALCIIVGIKGPDMKKNMRDFESQIQAAVSVKKPNTKPSETKK